jgi:hypothetical protein
MYLLLTQVWSLAWQVYDELFDFAINLVFIEQTLKRY